MASMTQDSPAKATSDLHLSYERLLRIQSDYVELMRLGQIPIAQSFKDTVDAQVLAMRALQPLTP